MYFTTTKMCPTKTCEKSLDVFIEEHSVPDPNTRYSFSCPNCGNNIVVRSAAVRNVETLSQDATIARRMALKYVLVVDDEADIRDTLSMLLSLDEFYVRTCKSRDDAMEILAHEVPDLIIVDWNMPGMLLETFIESVRQRHGALPMVLYSAATKASTMAESLSISFLPKTAEPDELISTTRKLLSA